MIKKSGKDYLKIIAAILFFLELQPYYMWNYTGTPMLLGVTLPLILIIYSHAKKTHIQTSIAFALLTIFCAILEGHNFFGCVSLTMVAILFICPNYLNEIYKYFHSFYTLLIGISAIIWVLVLIGAPLPFNVIPPLNSLKTTDYYQYPFLVMPGVNLDFSLFRTLQFCGPFDEPGVVGTIAFLILLIEHFNMRKVSNVIILISGLFSMSLFFYGGLFLYMLYSTTSRKGYLKVRIITLILFILFATLSYNYEVTRSAIWDRLEYDEYKGFVGNNRADEDMKLFIEQIRGTDEYWFGVHDNSIIERYSGSASIQNAILKYGIFGCVLYAFFFIIYAFKNIPKRKEAIVCLLFLFITLWQRPGMFSIPFVFFYIMLIHNFGNKQLTPQKKYEKVAY